MKLNKSKLLIILTIVLLTTLVVATSPVSAETRRISLLNATVIDGRGAIFTFRLFGDFEKFPAYVNFSGTHYKLNCNLKPSDNNILVCRGANRGLDSLGGTTVEVVVAGFSFTTFVSVKEVYCYGIYDYDPEGVWASIGKTCQSEKPPVGDAIEWYNPDWDDDFFYYFKNQGGFCGPQNDFGAGYYYPDCDDFPI